MNIHDLIRDALALIPPNYPKRNELVEELNEWGQDPTIDEVQDCFLYCIGTPPFTLPWKAKIAKMLLEYK